MLTILGSLGIGAVWGWLLGLVGGRFPARLSRTGWFVLLLSSGALAAVVALFTDGRLLLHFALAAAVAFYAHQTLLARIRARAR